MTAYRRKKGKDTWHWCRNCSNWPTFYYDERSSKPTSGELCNECLSKDREGIRWEFKYRRKEATLAVKDF